MESRAEPPSRAAALTRDSPTDLPPRGRTRTRLHDAAAGWVQKLRHDLRQRGPLPLKSLAFCQLLKAGTARARLIRIVSKHLNNLVITVTGDQIGESHTQDGATS